MVVILKSIKDVENSNLKIGDSYIADPFPPSDEENQFITQVMLKTRNDIVIAVEKYINSKNDNLKNKRNMRVK